MRGESADAALADAALAADDGFRIPAAVVSALLDGEQAVRVWREQRGLTQEALAAKAGISKAYLCQVETRKRVGALKTCGRLPMRWQSVLTNCTRIDSKAK